MITAKHTHLKLLKFDGVRVDESKARQFGRRLQLLGDADRVLVEDLIETLIVLRAGAGKREPAAAKELVQDLSLSTVTTLFDALKSKAKAAC